MKDLMVGKMYGYKLTVKNVPNEKADEVKRLCCEHLMKMAKALEDLEAKKV